MPSEEYCIIGTKVKEITAADMGDRVNINTKDGRHWYGKVADRAEGVLSIDNEDAHVLIDLDNENFCVVYAKNNYTINIETVPEDRLNRDVVEFRNYKNDPKVLHILHLVGLHLNKIDEKKKDKLIAAFNEIFGIKSIKRTSPQV